MKRQIPILFICALLCSCKDRHEASESNEHITNAVKIPERTEQSDPSDLRMDRSQNDAISRADWARLAGVAKKDWGSAVDWIEKHVSPNERDPLIARLVEEVCINDLERTEEGLGAIHSTDLRRNAFLIIISQWRKNNPQRLAEYAETHLNGWEKNQAFSEATQQTINLKDFEGAAGIVSKMPYSNDRSLVLKQLANSWLANDANRALGWAKNLELPEDKSNALLMIIQRLGDTGDREKLNAISADVADSNLKAATFRQLASIVAKEDGIIKATQWLNSVPEYYKLSTMASIIVVAQKSDPELATNLALGIQDDYQRNMALSQIQTEIIQKDPKAAINWINRLPNEAMKIQAVAQLASSWYNSDSIALSDWVNTLPKGLMRDAAVDSLARQLMNTDQRAGIDAAMTISDIGKRQAFLRDYHLQAKGN